MVWLANRYNIAPSAYYRFRLYKRANRTRVRSYVQHHEIVALLSELRDESVVATVRDKYLFYKHCVEHGLPTPPVLAYISDGRVVGLSGELDPADLPKDDLFSKPSDHYCGIGAESWRFDAAEDRWASATLQADAGGLLDHLHRQSEDEPYVLQPTLKNHPDVAPLSLGGLATARMVTVMRDGDGPHLLVASLRMPTGDSHVDNFAAGGIAAGIDLERGVLTRASAKDIHRDGLRHHPDTGGDILGRQLPDWEQARALVLKAHATLPHIQTVGWDVAWGPDGPTVVEGNLTWCAELIQVSHDAPLGATLFPEWYLGAHSRAAPSTL